MTKMPSKWIPKKGDLVRVVRNDVGAEISYLKNGNTTSRMVKPGDILAVHRATEDRIEYCYKHDILNYIPIKDVELYETCSCSFATLIGMGCICEVKR